MGYRVISTTHVIREGDNELHASLLRSGDHLVEGLKPVHTCVDRWLPVVPPLENNLCFTSALSTVLRKTTGDRRYVLVVETPGTEDLETGILCGKQALLDIIGILRAVSNKYEEPKRRLPYVVERKVVCVGPGIREIFPLKGEPRSIRLHERTLLWRCHRKSENREHRANEERKLDHGRDGYRENISGPWDCLDYISSE